MLDFNNINKLSPFLINKMDGYDVLYGGIGIAIGAGVVGYAISKTHRVIGEVRDTMARWSTLEKLLDVYGPKMKLEEFKVYGRSMLSLVNESEITEGKSPKTI